MSRWGVARPKCVYADPSLPANQSPVNLTGCVNIRNARISNKMKMKADKKIDLIPVVLLLVTKKRFLTFQSFVILARAPEIIKLSTKTYF